MHFLALLVVRHSFSFEALSVCHRANPVANALSPVQFQRSRRLAPQADLTATPISPDLCKALLVTLRIGANSSLPRALLHLLIGIPVHTTLLH